MAIGIAVPMLCFIVECTAALFSRLEADEVRQASRPKLAILIPAHNEEKTIAGTLSTIHSQLKNEDIILVVADNCTDQTAELARRNGATVIEREDATHRGKGYALDFGIRHLEKLPPQVVIVVDADCSIRSGSLDALSRAVVRTGCPAQSIYMMEPPVDAQPRDFISAFAFLVKNLARPLGCNRLGWPCLLTGTGMAFPWDVIRQAQLADGNIVEDMQLALTLALAGTPPRLCPGATIISHLPDHNEAAASQRKRWEHGHLQTLLRWAPKLLVRGCLERRPPLLALAMQLCVPPLALLVLLWIATTGTALLVKLLIGISWLPLLILTCAGAMMFAAVGGVWYRFSRAVVPARSLLSIPLYVTWKLPLYASFIFRRQKAWVRTAR